MGSSRSKSRARRVRWVCGFLHAHAYGAAQPGAASTTGFCGPSALRVFLFPLRLREPAIGKMHTQALSQSALASASRPGSSLPCLSPGAAAAVAGTVAAVAAGVGGRWGRGNTSNTSLYRRQRPGRAGLHARKLLAPGQPRRQQLPPNCRADSPDSFVDEDDYDDVSLSEPDRNHRKPPAEEDLQSQRSKGGTGVYVLAGKPASSSTMRMRDSDARAGAGRGCREKPVAILYVLVALSFAMWVAVLSLVMVKYSEISRELKMLSSNYSESVLQELADTRRGQDRMRTKMSTYYQELQDITALICKALPDSRRCSAGWKIFEKSCYSFSTESLSWDDAKQICSDQGSHLVIVNTELEQKFLKDNINSSSTYWLGLTDKLEEGTWLWINGEPASISYWNTWRENKDKDQQDCGSIGPDGIWTDERCSRAHHWICEKSWHC